LLVSIDVGLINEVNIAKFSFVKGVSSIHCLLTQLYVGLQVIPAHIIPRLLVSVDVDVWLVSSLEILGAEVCYICCINFCNYYKLDDV
jgi:hypothetical protein